MKKGYFITATDTGVGKTFIACALARCFKNKGIKVGVMKPVETGCKKKNGKLFPLDALALKKASGCPSPIHVINPYRFAPPLAPSIAARVSGIKIDLKKIKKSFVEISKKSDFMLVEGAGGLLTPISGNKTIADLILLLGLPIIIVTQSRLGCINHTTLALEYAKGAGIKIKGVILNNPDDKKDESRRFNRDELKRLGMPVIGEMRFVKKGKRIRLEDFMDIEIFPPPLAKGWAGGGFKVHACPKP